MAVCEKCWDDAYKKYWCNPTKSQADYYSELIEERKNNPCTPEEQAGEDAKICPKCKRKSIHQFAKICMNCK